MTPNNHCEACDGTGGQLVQVGPDSRALIPCEWCEGTGLHSVALAKVLGEGILDRKDPKIALQIAKLRLASQGIVIDRLSDLEL